MIARWWATGTIHLLGAVVGLTITALAADSVVAAALAIAAALTLFVLGMCRAGSGDPPSPGAKGDGHV